jgi:hypothetical protein
VTTVCCHAEGMEHFALAAMLKEFARSLPIAEQPDRGRKGAFRQRKKGEMLEDFLAERGVAVSY